VSSRWLEAIARRGGSEPAGHGASGWMQPAVVLAAAAADGDAWGVQVEEPWRLRLFLDATGAALMNEGRADAETGEAVEDSAPVGEVPGGGERRGDPPSPVVCVALPGPGDDVSQGAACGLIVTVAGWHDLVAPVDGTVTAVNLDVLDRPSAVLVPGPSQWLVEVLLRRPTEVSSGG
jgi:hypothetical protein